MHWNLPFRGDEEYFVDAVYPILYKISIASVFLLVTLLVTLIARYKVNIMKMIFKDKELSLSTTFLLTLLILTMMNDLVYIVFLYPSIHTYAHQVLRTFASGVLIVLMIKVIYKIRTYHRNWFLLITYVLAMLLILAPLYRCIVTSINIDHILPIRFYGTSASSIIFLVEKTENELFLFTDSRIAGYIYYRLTSLDKSINIHAQGFLAPPFNYTDNCRKNMECYYLIMKSFEIIPLRIAQAPWMFIKPLGRKYHLIVTENSLIYNQGLSAILIVSN